MKPPIYPRWGPLAGGKGYFKDRHRGLCTPACASAEGISTGTGRHPRLRHDTSGSRAPPGFNPRWWITTKSGPSSLPRRFYPRRSGPVDCVAPHPYFTPRCRSRSSPSIFPKREPGRRSKFLSTPGIIWYVKKV